MLEDNRSTLAYVFERWRRIQTHLSKFASSNSAFAHDLQDFMAHENGKPWKARLDRQVMPVHVTAFFLQPYNFDTEMTERLQDQIIQSFQQYTPDYEATLRQFYDFRSRRGPFNAASRAWK